jgi:hypothetical protein
VLGQGVGRLRVERFRRLSHRPIGVLHQVERQESPEDKHRYERSDGPDQGLPDVRRGRLEARDRLVDRVDQRTGQPAPPELVRESVGAQIHGLDDRVRIRHEREDDERHDHQDRNQREEARDGGGPAWTPTAARSKHTNHRAECRGDERAHEDREDRRREDERELRRDEGEAGEDEDAPPDVRGTDHPRRQERIRTRRCVVERLRQLVAIWLAIGQRSAARMA